MKFDFNPAGRGFSLAAAGLAAAGLFLAPVAGASGDVTVNPQLASFQQRFDRGAEPVEVAEGVHAVFGPEYANFSVVEGSDGLIVIDTGWFEGTVRPVWKKLAARLGKPVRAVIYTHPHADHFGAASVILEGAPGEVAIYGPAGWRERMRYSTTHQYFMIYQRAYEQMGVMLPEGPEGTVGAGVGPSPRGDGVSTFVPPTVTVAEPQTIEIAGVELQLLPSAADIHSHMMVWLPGQRVLFGGDVLGGTMPYIATPRFEPDRTPQGFLDSLELALSLEPEVLVPGHGRLLQGADDARDVVQANIDFIRFLSDQVQRYIARGYSADQIIDRIEIPEALASHPDLQPHYHRLDWLIRGLTLKTAGFASDVTALSRLTQREEDKRLFALLGGREAVLEAAVNALEEGDARWAASLATRLLEQYPDDPRVREVRLAALRDIASHTLSASERNYLLTAVKEETDGIDWNAEIGDRALALAAKRPAGALLDEMRYRYRVEAAPEEARTFTIAVSGESGVHQLLATPYALVYSAVSDSGAEPAVTLSRETLGRLWARRLSWPEAYSQGLLGSQDDAAKLAALIE